MLTASDILELPGGSPGPHPSGSGGPYPGPWIQERVLALDTGPGSAFTHSVTLDKLFNLSESQLPLEKGKNNPISKLYRLKPEKLVSVITDLFNTGITFNIGIQYLVVASRLELLLFAKIETLL